MTFESEGSQFFICHSSERDVCIFVTSYIGFAKTTEVDHSIIFSVYHLRACVSSECITVWADGDVRKCKTIHSEFQYNIVFRYAWRIFYTLSL